MDIKRIIKRRNNEIKGFFNEKEHIYTVGKEKTILESVTKFKKKYFPFDAEAIAQKLANFSKGKKTKEEYLAEWKKTAEFGTHIHSLAELYVNGEELVEPEVNQIIHVIDFVEENKFKHIASEFQVYSPALGIAGTVDWLAEDEKGRLWIIDWKTTKNINTSAYENANSPIEHLKNSKINGFAFQTSIYRFILENEYNIGKEIYGIMIVQLNLNKTYKIYSSENKKLPYLKEEIYKIMFNLE